MCALAAVPPITTGPGLGGLADWLQALPRGACVTLLNDHNLPAVGGELQDFPFWALILHNGPGAASWRSAAKQMLPGPHAVPAAPRAHSSPADRGASSFLPPDPFPLAAVAPDGAHGCENYGIRNLKLRHIKADPRNMQHLRQSINIAMYKSAIVLAGGWRGVGAACQVRSGGFVLQEVLAPVVAYQAAGCIPF